MKQFCLWLFCVVSVMVARAQDPAYPAAPATPANLSTAEYFIDTDPGIGNGTAIPIAQVVNVSNFATGVNTTGLSNGVHTLFIRSKNADGSWSLAYLRQFIVDFDPAYTTAPAAAQNIVAAEYFVDTDPGLGNGTSIAITPGVTISNLNVAVNITGLTTGVHRVYIRTRNAEGSWSLTQVKDFIVDANPDYPNAPAAAGNIIAAEYFIDTDPGMGNATAIAISPNTTISNLSFVANTPGLSAGVHRIYLRTKNAEGSWSLTQVKDFIVELNVDYPLPPVAAGNIVAAEYFIDTDPGLGNATAIAVTPGTNISNLSYNANTGGLSLGVHRIFLRTKNAEGAWSLTNVSTFNVDQDYGYPPAPVAAGSVVAAEYFIDTDPGVGAGTNITITPGVDVSNINATINTSALANGQHFLYIRTKNAEGAWSLTNHGSFYKDLISLNADSLLYGLVPVNTTATLDLIVTNNSTSPQTITAVTTTAPFSSDFTSTITIPGTSKDTLHIAFTPTAANTYIQNLQLTTSAGNYNVGLRGTGIAQVPSWALSPANGHNYGNVAVNGTSSFSFTIQNTGNVPVTLTNVTTGNAAFVPTFTAGTVIQPNNFTSIAIAFNPTAVNSYTGQLSIQSSTSGVATVTTTLTGNGYNPGAPPVLQLVAGSPFNNTTGVNPVAGQPGNFTYKVLYTSPNNRAPQSGFPRVSIDLNGDQDFVDLDEGTYIMSKETPGTDYVTGVVYAYTFTHNSITSNAGYKFSATDDQGNSATSGAVNYISGPIVTNDRVDLRIFANDISFSPAAGIQPNQSFQVFARVSNNTAIPATNVPVKFYRDTILIGEDVIPSVAANSSTTISRTLSFAAEGFYPIKVWVDSLNTLNDINTLNNYAIRPVTVGSPNLPGRIDVTTDYSIQQCPQVKVLIFGRATYGGFATSNPAVAGAEVTIITPNQRITTTTNANGDYSYLLTGVTCGGTFEYFVRVTDFTFTSDSTLAHKTFNLPCPPPSACVPPPSMGGISAMASNAPCANIVGQNGQVSIRLKYRERNLANFWCAWDEIKKDTLRIFQDGVLIQTIGSADYSHGPGEEVIVPINIPLNSTTPTVISATLSYVYVEYTQIPSSLYHGNNIAMSSSGSTSLAAEPNVPDLTIQNFEQTSFTSFRFNNANIKCVNAGAHNVKIYDSIPGGPRTLIATRNVSSLAAGTAISMSYSDPNFTSGQHFIRVITDEDDVIPESSNFNNNFLFPFFVAKSELFIDRITVTPTDLDPGKKTVFRARVKNIGRTTQSPFTVQFTAGGVQFGALKTVTVLPENGVLEVVSDSLTINTLVNSCGDTIIATADFGNTIDEQDNFNNSFRIIVRPDIAPYQLPGEVGSAGNPAVVRVFTTNQFYPAIRNIGLRDAKDVTVRFELNNNWIGNDTVNHVKAGEIFAGHASFTRMFTVAGTYVVRVTADTSNSVCELLEGNNQGDFYIKVVDSKPDLEVLSQYISPSSLNPNIGQGISIVGTVRNTGGQATTASVLRFTVDGTQLGVDVPINALQPGRDTTVAATAMFSSMLPGVKVIRLFADPDNTMIEEREDNNEASRTMIVGDAPDMVRVGMLLFNPTGFSAGDSARLSFYIKNQGPHEGNAMVRIKVYDTTYALMGIDSLPFYVASGDSVLISKRMFFAKDEGYVVTEIYNSFPLESNMLNNIDTLRFTTVAKMKQAVTINGDLDMIMAAPQQLPGWIGGKIMLGNFDLVVNGRVINYDSTRFIITNGTGRLKMVNSNAENVFPVASSDSSLNFVKLNNTGTPDNFSVRVAPYVLQQGNNGDTVRAGHVNRTWFMEEETPGGSNVTAEFWWSTDHEQSSFNRTMSRTAHYTTAWEYGAIGAAVLGRYNQYSKVQAGFTSFSPFTINSPGGALPLTFLSFTATNRPEDVLLQWRTEAEVNTSHFIIERSGDGVGFSSIGSVTSMNTAGVHDYESVDRSPLNGVSYYRLKQVDIDGRFVYSNVVKITRSNSKPIVLYPNPASTFIRLQHIQPGEVKTVQLFSTQGALIWQMSNPSSLEWNISKLANAMYQLRITKSDGEVTTISFIKY